MSTEKYDFPGVGGHRLSGRLELPDGQPTAYAVFAHCFTCGKDARAATRIARRLGELGIATLRFDFTGLGGSEGEFGNAGFTSNIDDLVAAADHLRVNRIAPSLLVGHSLGGAAVLAAAGRIPEIKAIATIGAPFDAAHVLHLFGGHLPASDRNEPTDVTIGGRLFRIGGSFVDDLARQDQGGRIAGLRRSLLVLHAPNDATVGIDNASQIFLKAKHPKSFVSLDGADHLLSNPRDAEYAATVIAAWASRYIGDQAPPATADSAVAGQVVVEETGAGKFQNRVRIGRHALLADEPASFGGLDSGPSPYDFLLAGLGACTAMTLRLYADRKGIPLRRVRVGLDHNKVHAADCADCETREGKIDEIVKTIVVEGDLDAEQRARLIEIADKCPVHRTLHSEIKIRTQSP
ncbi:MAG: alpha/beta fold hydrolase [Rhodospirillales bacterium]|nr:alpha/beta fold hydrolase [Rhodospirillales bacterium]